MENKKGKSPYELQGALNNVAGKAKNEAKLQQIQTSKQTLTYEQLLEKPAEISCRNGSVFGMNTHANTKCRKYILSFIISLSKQGYTQHLLPSSPASLHVKD